MAGVLRVRDTAGGWVRNAREQRSAKKQARIRLATQCLPLRPAPTLAAAGPWPGPYAQRRDALVDTYMSPLMKYPFLFTMIIHSYRCLRMQERKNVSVD